MDNEEMTINKLTLSYIFNRTSITNVKLRYKVSMLKQPMICHITHHTCNKGNSHYEPLFCTFPWHIRHLL